METFAILVYSLFAVGMILLFIYGINLIYLSFNSYSQKKKTYEKIQNHPLVTIQLPVFNERYVVQRLIKAASEINWPQDKLEIQVLDDSTDDTTQIIQETIKKINHSNIKHLHRTNRQGFKAGALEEGMNKAQGEFIAIFDADFIPKKDFLQKTIPRFKENTAMVQTRWSYVNRSNSLLTEIQGIVLDAHFAVDQRARENANVPFNFNGTAGVWRKKAIIESGGWQHDTLTEDLDLSYRAQLMGWKCAYLNDVDSPSELPASVDGLRLQQQRWAKGNMQCAFKLLKPILRSSMTFKQKHGVHACIRN